MASKYLQKFPVPLGFEGILKDFTRQILRDQPQNILEYAASYFQVMEEGKKFQNKSYINSHSKKQQIKTDSINNDNPIVSGNVTNVVRRINERIDRQCYDKNSIEHRRNDDNLTNQIKENPLQQSKQQSIYKNQKPKKPAHDERVSIQLHPEQLKSVSQDYNNFGGENNITQAYQPSTNTIIVDEGHKYIEEVNQQATNEVVQQQLGRQQSQEQIRTQNIVPDNSQNKVPKSQASITD